MVIGVAVGNCWSMRLDKRAVALGIAAVAVAVLLGALAGAVAGVLAALAGLVPAVLWQVASGRQAGTGAAAGLLAAAARDMAPPSGEVVSLAGYLRPEAAVVSFWPRAELDWLRGWLASGRRADVALVTGQAGAGKTRLALRLADEAGQQLGWRCYWVPAGGEEQVMRPTMQSRKPVLVVCDYAETRPGLAGLLARVMGAADGPVVRVLLLARSAEEWWQQLIAESDAKNGDILAAVRPLTLGPLAGPAGQEQVFRQALAAFAARLGTDVPQKRLPAATGAVALVVHAAALLAVLDSRSPASDTEPREGAGPDPYPGRHAADGAEEVIGRLLWHEARYWEHSQVRYGLNPGLGATVTRRVVTAGTLVGADDEESAVALLIAVSDLADPAVRGRTARWLHDLYPAEPDGRQQEWIGPLRPDLVAETLIASVLSSQPGLARALLTGLSAARATRALTILARAAVTSPVATIVLRDAISSDPAGLAVPAMGVAVETNPAVGDLLADALQAGQWPLKLVGDITRALPDTSTALAGTAAAAYQRLAEASAVGTREHSGALHNLSRWLGQLGRQEEALAAIEQAVTSYRQLAAGQPDPFLPRLAHSLNNQSLLLRDLGRPEEGLAAIEEAHGLYRQLAASRPGEFIFDVAGSLNNLCLPLSDLGRREEALAAIEEAVRLGRQLAASQPDEFTSFLAGSQANLAVRRTALGRQEDALAAIEEAVRLYRQLTTARPDEFTPSLASSLDVLAACLHELGRWGDALAAIEEATGLYRQLTAARPDVYAPRLRSSLLLMTEVLTSLDRDSDAHNAGAEADRMQ
jgi:tetratricopeptide (TPR) repeat protein